jgi:hypothetical protein
METNKLLLNNDDDFKVGDWIFTFEKAVMPKSKIGSSGGKGFKPNVALQIESIDEYTTDNVYWFKDWAHGIYGGNFRKATPEEIKDSEHLKEDKKRYPKININGYDGKFFDDYIVFGRAKINTEFILKLNDILSNDYWEKNEFKNIESVQIGNGYFTKNQIKEIANFYIQKNC